MKKLKSLKLTPLIGDGNVGINSLGNLKTEFKTNPAYRGRKLENILLLFVNMVQFKTNPAYRGQNLL